MASEAVTVPQPDTSDEQVEKKVVEEAKPDELQQVEVKPPEAPLVPVVEEEKAEVAPVVGEAVKIVEPPVVEDVIKTDEEEKLPAGVVTVDEVTKIEDAAEPVVEEKLEVVPPEVTKTPEPVEEEKPVAAPPSVEEVVKPEEEKKSVSAPAVEQVIKTEDVAEVVEEEKPVVAEEVIKTEDVTLPVEEEAKPDAPPAVEFIKTAALAEEEKPVELVAETIEEEIPVAAPVVEEGTKTDTPVDEDKPVPAPAAEVAADPVVEEKLQVAPEAVVTPEPAEKLVEASVEIIDKSERSLPEEVVPAAVEEENVAAVAEDKKEEHEAAPTTLVAEAIKEAVSPAEVIQLGKTEAAVTELTKLEETADPLETGTGRTLADKLSEEKTSDSGQVEPATEENDGTKTDRELPVESETKTTTPKQSSNLLSKVKKSLVKAKKAILGKSPSTKNPPVPVTNQDLQVK